jgi:hypothetical protein
LTPLDAYYYLIYAFRKLGGPYSKDPGMQEWRAFSLLLFINVEVMATLVFLGAPRLFAHANILAFSIGCALPAVFFTYWILGKRKRYARSVAMFETWSRTKRLFADVLVAAVLLLSLALPTFFTD